MQSKRTDNGPQLFPFFSPDAFPVTSEKTRNHPESLHYIVTLGEKGTSSRWSVLAILYSLRRAGESVFPNQGPGPYRRDVYGVPRVTSFATSEPKTFAMPSQTLPAVSQSSFESASESDDPPYVPVLGLDRDATIQHANEAVRRTLEYPPDAALEPCFFSHVHGRNLRQVMRDLAHMVSHRKQRTRWLLRLRTGNGRWRWYRATARNRLDRPDALIRVHLRPL